MTIDKDIRSGFMTINVVYHGGHDAPQHPASDLEQLVVPQTFQLLVPDVVDLGHKRTFPGIELNDLHAPQHLVLNLDALVLVEISKEKKSKFEMNYIEKCLKKTMGCKSGKHISKKK